MVPPLEAASVPRVRPPRSKDDIILSAGLAGWRGAIERLEGRRKRPRMKLVPPVCLSYPVRATYIPDGGGGGRSGQRGQRRGGQRGEVLQLRHLRVPGLCELVRVRRGPGSRAAGHWHAVLLPPVRRRRLSFVENRGLVR